MRLIFIFCFILFNLSAIGQANTFIRTYNLPGMNGGLALAVMEDGGFVGTGQHNDPALGCRIYAYRIDECGNIIWFNLYNGGGGVAIDGTDDNGVIIAADGSRLLKIDNLGNAEWEKTYSSVSGYMTAVIQTTDNGYFAGGQSGQLLKLNSLGDVTWSAQVSGNYIHALDEFPNGDLMYFSWDGNSFWVGRVSTLGVLIWENQYSSGVSSGDAHNEWGGEAIIDENLSRITVASNSSNNSGDVLVTSLDYNGNIITSNAFGSVSASEFVRSIDITDDGGYIIGGGTYGYNTTSTSTLTQILGLTPENLSGRDILLFKVDSSLNFEWSSVIGCGSTEKAIGVRANQDNGYTVSAYTDGSFFGAIDVDPLFIKTDSMGRVGCQQYSPFLIQTSIATSVTPTNNLSMNSSIATANSIILDTILPSDYYMCLDCSTTPFFTLSDTTLCVGDTTYFVNGSSGLTCFQDWYVDGNLIEAEADCTAFAFTTPGLHNILLETNCGNGSVQYDLNFYVNNIKLYVTDISEFNGYEISCNSYNTGFIETYATSPFPPVNYNWTTPNPINPNQYNLKKGIYTLQLTDDYGCIFDTTFILQEPPFLMLTSNFAHDTCYRKVGMAEVIVAGGVFPYNYLWSNNSTFATINNLNGGNYTVTITDANNCKKSEQFYIDPDFIEGPTAEFNVIPDLNIHHLYRQMENPIIFIDKSIDEFTLITNWFWEFEDGFVSNEQDSRHSFPEIGDFNVTLAIENLYGCVDTITKRVIIEEFLLYIPNSFTPQDDGINDVFLPKGIGVKNYELKIYNRWGKHFFTSDDLNIGWGGTTDRKDKIAQNGIYVYLINVTDVFGEKHTYNGQVTLIK